MIQEILDYLLIRSVLLNSTSEEMINTINDTKTFPYIIKNINLLMQQEDFILLDKSLQYKVVDILQKFRFDYIKDKEVNDQMNYIIDRLKTYKEMSYDRKRYLVNEWIKQEAKTRELPWYYHTIKNLVSLISLDMYYFQRMIVTDEPFEIDNVVEYLSLLNIILNKFPDCFQEDKLFLELTREKCKMIKSISGFPKFIRKINKSILKRLNENFEVNEEVNKKVKENLSYQLIKRG